MQQESIHFLRDSLIHHRDLRNALDQKASLLLGLAGVIFALSVSHLPETPFLVLAVSSLLTVFLTIFVVFLPFRSKKGVKPGSMCWWGFIGGGFDQYREEIDRILDSEKEISKEYIKEIWNLANYSIKPKVKILKWASSIQLIGFLLGFVLFFV